MKFSSQKGFTLLEVSIATAIAALGIIATLQMRATQAQVDTAKSIAQVYERLNNAVGSYMTIYYEQIIAKGRLNPECGKSNYQVPDGLYNVVSRGSECQLTLTLQGKNEGRTVENFLQPTPEELASLGLLTGNDGRYQNSLPFPSYSTAGGSLPDAIGVYGNQTLRVINQVNGTWARSGMAFMVELMCMNQTDPIKDKGTCKSDSYDLRSMVYNIQPYSNGGNNDVLLYRTMEAAGGGISYLSDTRLSGQLMGANGVGQLQNPVVVRKNGQGAPFILAMRNGYASAGKDVFVRRDGSKTLTGDWNVGNKSIVGINSVEAGSVTAGSVTGGSVTGGTGFFGTFLGGVRAALNATTAYFSGDVIVDANLNVAKDTQVSGALSVVGSSTLKSDLTVAGASKLNSDLAVAGNTVLAGVTKVGDFRIENEAVLGGDCNPSTQTLSRASANSSGYKNNLRLLVCDPASSKWSTPQKDYGSSIDGLESITSGLQVTTNNLSKKKLVVYTDVLTWQAATYNTNFKDRYQTVDNNQATGAGRTWVPTKFACNNGDMPPVLVSLDWVAEPGQTLVYDVGCKNGKWYFAMGPKERNIEYGNVCNSGLDSKLTNPVRDIYVPPYTTINYQESNCISVNLVTPNFNANSITASVMILRYE